MEQVFSFWRGEVPLVQAFWIWGVAVWIILEFLLTFAPASPLEQTLRLVDPVYPVFSAVGIFRSAKIYSGNKAFRIAGLIVPVVYALFSILIGGWAMVVN